MKNNIIVAGIITATVVTIGFIKRFYDDYEKDLKLDLEGKKAKSSSKNQNSAEE